MRCSAGEGSAIRRRAWHLRHSGFCLLVASEVACSTCSPCAKLQTSNPTAAERLPQMTLLTAVGFDNPSQRCFGALSQRREKQPQHGICGCYLLPATCTSVTRQTSSTSGPVTTQPMLNWMASAHLLRLSSGLYPKHCGGHVTDW